MAGKSVALGLIVIRRQLSKCDVKLSRIRNESEMSEKFILFFVDNFVSGEECEALMNLIDRHARYLPDPYGGQAHCRCKRVGFNQLTGEWQGMLSERLARALVLPPELCRDLQGQLYEKGEYYGPHWDAFHRDAPHYESEMARGGQRTFTAMIYLNQPPAGGHTDFSALGVAIWPHPGRVVFWNNLDENGDPHRLSKHGGAPVVRGRKYIVTAWFRERADER